MCVSITLRKRLLRAVRRLQSLILIMLKRRRFTQRHLCSYDQTAWLRGGAQRATRAPFFRKFAATDLATRDRKFW
jgi:hypothetical protein